MTKGVVSERMEGKTESRKSNGNVGKRDIVIDYAFFAILFLVMMVYLLKLFHEQCVQSMQPDGLYPSDMEAYILEMRGLDSGYSFPYPILFKTAAVFYLFMNQYWAMACATALFNGLAVVITKVALNRLTGDKLGELFPKHRWIAGICISAVSVGLFFVSMLYPPEGIYLPGIKYNYLGVFTPNPFHNATYMAARPFAILAFLWYVKLLDVYEKGGDRKDYILFAFFLLAATMTKPSFTIVLVGAAGLIMLYRLFRSRFSNLRQTILLGLTFIPTFIDLLYQFNGVFVPDEGVEGGIGFCFGSIWSKYCDNIPLAIGLAVGFPLLVLVLNYKELKSNTLYRFSWQIYIMSFCMAFFLYEKGFRAAHFNFSWGYMYGIFFAFFGALVVLLRATAAKRHPVRLTLQWMAFLWHLLCGLWYFGNFFQGRMYY